MDSYGIRQIVRYIQKNCKTTITPKQSEQLRQMIRMREYNIYKLRILYRIAIDNFVYPVCPYCRQAIRNQEELTIDHIVPRSKGGTDAIANLQPMHKQCNSEKGNEIPELVVSTPTTIVKERPKKHHLYRTETISGHDTEELKRKCDQADSNIRKHRYSTVRHGRHR
ncbi:MAG: HNH endonuclease [Alphaproteobacteria bacterium]|nr:HNH endonuclease [Alphaproteobacteria bacterium]